MHRRFLCDIIDLVAIVEDYEYLDDKIIYEIGGFDDNFEPILKIEIV